MENEDKRVIIKDIIKEEDKKYLEKISHDFYSHTLHLTDIDEYSKEESIIDERKNYSKNIYKWIGMAGGTLLVLMMVD